jgi:hypothetical protein
MSARSTAVTGQQYFSVLAVFLFLTVLLSPFGQGDELASTDDVLAVSPSGDWSGEEQPWGQYGRTPTHNQTAPLHGPDGGPGEGNLSAVNELMTLENPVVNWQVFETGEGSDAYGSVIGDFSPSVVATEAARERCGAGTLFPVLISSDVVDGNRESFLNIVSGNDAKIAWRVSLGNTEAIRSTPIIHDIDADNFPEIIVVYDTASALNIDVWSPRLTCTESNWQVSGHSNELLWSYSDADVRIGSPSPHIWTANSDHKAVTQPLLADLELDGVPELVLAVVDDPENNPSVYIQSYALTTVQPSSSDWSVNLDRGTHPSDPVWAKLDSTTTSILLTTIDANSGNELPFKVPILIPIPLAFVYRAPLLRNWTPMRHRKWFSRSQQTPTAEHLAQEHGSLGWTSLRRLKCSISVRPTGMQTPNLRPWTPTMTAYPTGCVGRHGTRIQP